MRNVHAELWESYEDITPAVIADPMDATQEKKSPSKETIPLFVATTIAPIIPNIYSGEQRAIEVNFRVLPDVKSGTYLIPINIEYTDASGKGFETEEKVPVVINMKPDIFIEIKESSLRTKGLAGDVKITIANRGQTSLRYATLDLTDTDAFKLLSAPREVYLGTLEPGESKEGMFMLLPNELNISIPVRLSYKDQNNKEVTISKTLPYTITNRNYYMDLGYDTLIIWIVLGLVVLALTAFYASHLSRRN